MIIVEVKYAAMVLTLTLAVVWLAALGAEQASASFGIADAEMSFEDQGGLTLSQAGAHPYAMSTRVDFITEDLEGGAVKPSEAIKDLTTVLPEGIAGAPIATPRCSAAQFAQVVYGEAVTPGCSDSSAVGVIELTAAFAPVLSESLEPVPLPIYNLNPGLGSAARFGFYFTGVPVVFDVKLSEQAPHRLVAIFRNSPQTLLIYGAKLTIWGDPFHESHDAERGICRTTEADDLCPAVGDGKALITLPTSCTDPLRTEFRGNSWQHPEILFLAHSVTNDGAEPPGPLTLSGCEKLGFDPAALAVPNTNRAASPSGFSFSIDIDDPGLLDPDELAGSHLKKAVVTLPLGMRVNSAAAGGLGACSEAQLARERYDSLFGEGCPASSRVASVEVETPLLEEHLSGSIFLASPFAHPLEEFLVGYLVIKQPERGILLRITGEIELDPNTGQVTASFDQNPQLPFSDLRVSFFGGARAALSTPKICGVYSSTSELFPWSGSPSLSADHPFQISQSEGSSACPTSRLQVRFEPRLTAGTTSAIAGRHTPFVMRLTRDSGDEDIRDLELTLPPGLTGKLAGIPYCSEASLAKFKGRANTAPGTAQGEISSPSCPEASRVGRAVIGAGTGPSPFYLNTARVYLAGPYRGAPLSLAVIAPVEAGPFDLGVVMVRNALHIDPSTAQITVQSDPIPSIIEGIPVEIRDLRVIVDRSDFTLNPTSCDPLEISATVGATGGKSTTLSNRFQVGECAALGFKPRFGMRILNAGRRSTLRSFNPAMRFTVRPRPGDANMGPTRVTLPSSLNLDQSNLDTICTRAQFAERNCPQGAVVGFAKAWSPLLDEPVRGRVYLGSSTNPLPDIIADLDGQVRVVLQGQVDTAKGVRIRNTFSVVPDVPVSLFQLTMRGGKRSGILVNNTDQCRHNRRGVAAFQGANGKRHVTRPRIGLRFKGCKKVVKRQARKQAKRKQAQRSQAAIAAVNGPILSWSAAN